MDKDTQAYVRNPIKLKNVSTLTGLTWQATSNIVEKFRERRRRFLIPSLYENTRLQEDNLIDISHEALIRQWPRLTEWAKDEEMLAKDYRLLVQDALLQKGGKGELWHGLNLQRALKWQENIHQLYPTDRQEAWARRHAQRFDNPEHFKIAKAFLETSQKDYEERKKREEEERQRDSQREQLLKEAELRESLKQIKLQRWRLAWATTAAGLVLTTAVAFWGYWERNQALFAKQQIEQLEQTRTSELFESQRTHAELLAKEENYVQAKSTLDKTRELDQDIPAPRRHARDLLATLVNLRGGTTDNVYEGASVALSSLALSANGQWIATGGENGTLVLFDRQTKQMVHHLIGHKGTVRAVVFDPQNNWLLSGGEVSDGKGGQIIQWSLPSGATQRTWSTTVPVWALAISPDGKQLANSNGKEITLRLIDADPNSPLLTLSGHEDKVSALAYDPTGKWLASGSYDRTIRLWQVDNGILQHTLQGHADKVQNVLFHPNGKYLASGSTDKTIWLWEVETGHPVQIFNGHQNTVFGLGFITPTDDATGPTLLASSSADRTVHLWDLDSGITLRVLQGHTAQVTGLTAQTRQLFTASNDGTIRQWDFNLPQQHLLPLSQEAASVAIAPDGKSVVVGLANGSLQSYALPTLEPLWKQENAHAKDVQRLTFSPDHSLLASASLDKTVKLWRVEQDTIQLVKTFSDYQAGINGLAFSADSQYLVTASYDKRIGVFNLNTDQPPQWTDYDGEEVNSVAFDANGKQLLSAGDQTVRLWQFDQGKLTLLKSFPKEPDLLWATLSSDGQQYTRVGRNLPVTVYSLPDGRPLHDLPGHENSVLRVFYTPDNQQLVTIGGDATIRFWDLTKSPGSELFTLPLPARPNPPAPVWDFDFRCTPAGCWIAVPLTRGQLVLYELGQLYE